MARVLPEMSESELVRLEEKSPGEARVIERVAYCPMPGSFFMAYAV